MSSLMPSLAACLDRMPLVAILRGLDPHKAVDTGAALVDAGFHIIEVPLNSPAPLDSINALAERFGGTTLIGAGTVLDLASVSQVADAGGRLVVMPHADAAVVRAAKAAGLAALPGIATPTEAFAALAAGADGLKLFPAEANPPAVLKAMRAVLPDVPVLPVGGIDVAAMTGYMAAGANGFGLGSALFKPEMPVAEVARNAAAFVAEMRRLRSA